MFQFTKEILADSLTHAEFMDLTKSILASDVKESPYDKESYFNYTTVNYNRAGKILRNFQLDKKLYNLLSEEAENWTWVLLNEPWCGDGSFIQPVLYAMSLAGGGSIDFKVILRDKHPEIMEHFLTNGGMAIPKLICLDKELNIMATWGPRPQELQSQFNEWKKEEDFDINTKIKKVNRWYLKDKTLSIQKEFIDLIKKMK
jgi:hypothetical protein